MLVIQCVLECGQPLSFFPSCFFHVLVYFKFSLHQFLIFILQILKPVLQLFNVTKFFFCSCAIRLVIDNVVQEFMEFLKLFLLKFLPCKVVLRLLQLLLKVLNLNLLVLYYLVFLLKLSLLLLFQIVLSGDGADLLFDFVNHLLLLLLELVLLDLEFLCILYDLLLLTVKLLIGFSFFALPLQQPHCLKWSLAYLQL